MFSSITSYLFGATDPETESNGTQEEATQEPTTPTPNLETTPTEDEWILVEKADLRSGKRTRQQSPDEARKRHHTDFNVKFASTNPFSVLSQDGGSHDTSSGTSSDCPEYSDSDMSAVVHPSMEESWLVTPPACFTAGTSRMETSSMENLLIEHPSMSVYHHRGRQSSTGMESENSESSTEEESGKTESSQAGLSRHQPPHRPRALAARIGLQAKTVKSMQKAHQRQSHKDLSKNNLRQVNHNQGKHVCKHVVHQPRQRSTTVAKKQ